MHTFESMKRKKNTIKQFTFSARPDVFSLPQQKKIIKVKREF
jgi:hypothetical protein